MIIQRYYGQGGMLVPSPDGDVVMHADHLVEVEWEKDVLTREGIAYADKRVLAERQRIVEILRDFYVDPQVIVAAIEGSI